MRTKYLDQRHDSYRVNVAVTDGQLLGYVWFGDSHHSFLILLTVAHLSAPWFCTTEVYFLFLSIQSLNSFLHTCNHAHRKLHGFMPLRTSFTCNIAYFQFSWPFYSIITMISFLNSLTKFLIGLWTHTLSANLLPLVLPTGGNTLYLLACELFH